MPLERIFNLTFQLNGWFMRNFFSSKIQSMYTIESFLFTTNKKGKKMKSNQNVTKSFLLILSLCVCIFCHLFSHQRFFLFCVIITIWDYNEGKNPPECVKKIKNAKKPNLRDEQRFWSRQIFFAVQKQAFNLISMCSYCSVSRFFLFIALACQYYLSAGREQIKKGDSEKKTAHKSQLEFAYEITPP